MTSSGTFGCIDSGVPPKSSTSDQHMLFRYLGRDHSEAAEDVQFHHHRVLRTFSGKYNEAEMPVSSMPIEETELKGTEHLMQRGCGVTHNKTNVKTHKVHLVNIWK